MRGKRLWDCDNFKRLLLLLLKAEAMLWHPLSFDHYVKLLCSALALNTLQSG